jgi:alkanesulfonate monooxygenase SsuD/methylene tetrahydromethanopterin reductase-like flavin-dependent oxidoreductase (luciferase family)
VLVGGHTPTAMRRAARIGDGWLAGGGTSSAFSGLAARMLSTWAEHGRAGRPRLAALVYVSLGPDGQDRAQRYLSRYYAFLGERHRHVVAGVLDSPQRLRRSVEEFALAGCDELMLLPCSPDPAEVDRIADAVTG